MLVCGSFIQLSLKDKIFWNYCILRFGGIGNNSPQITSSCICCTRSQSRGASGSFEKLIIAAHCTTTTTPPLRNSNKNSTKINILTLFWLLCSVIVCYSLVKSLVLVSRFCLVWQGDSLLKSNLPASVYVARFAHVSFLLTCFFYTIAFCPWHVSSVLLLIPPTSVGERGKKWTRCHFNRGQKKMKLFISH